MRGLCDQDTRRSYRQRARHDQLVQEDRLAVHTSVAIGVVEDDDLADRLVFANTVDVGHEATHLDHPKTSALVPGDGDRVFNERLGRDQLRPEPIGKPQSRKAVLG